MNRSNARHRFKSMRFLSNLLHPGILCCIILLTSFATVDFDYPRKKTTAPPVSSTADTRIGQYAARLTEGQPAKKSGFHLLPDAIDALAIRLILAERAEATIDAQYYLVKSDDAGLAFIRSLLAAADRGVRVRLLIDDMFTGGKDLGLAALDHHPNFEVRVFNPFARRSARFMDGLTDLSRINRRMHNKSFTVDNQVTIIGGRNIADEYFGSRADAHFGDLDAISVGPIVEEVSRAFDIYWNHEQATPLPAFAKIPEDKDAALEDVRRLLEESRQTVSNGVYAKAIRDSAEKMLENDVGIYHWAPYELTVDSPDKSFRKKAAEASTMKLDLANSLMSARKEIILISPYFVPRRSGIEALLALEERGVEITVVTNSLSANNQFTVHGGYMPSRKPLLEGGVRIFEVRRDAHFQGQHLIAADSGKFTLHTKAFLVDDRELFVGSFNFDPRSANINTEMGVIIRSQEMADPLQDQVYEALPNLAWEVVLDDRGRLRWEGYDQDGNTVTLSKEPETSAWDRFMANFIRFLPVHSQL